MDDIKVVRTVHVQASSRSEIAQVRDIAYSSNDRNVLLQSISIGKRGVIRRSEDNGKSWEAVEEWTSEEPLGDGLVLERGLPEVFCDPDNGLVIRFFITARNNPNIVPWDYARSPMTRTRKIFFQTSQNEGQTWSEPERLIMQGGDYDETHWMDGVYYGKNGACIEGSQIIKNRRGETLAPMWGTRLFENDDIINPNADPATSNPDGTVEHFSGCFFGRWRADGSGIDWSVSESVRLPLKYSCDGADEPSVDYLPDGRLFMVLRARTYPHTGQKLPSLHYYTLSNDDGRTWSEPEPLLYDDGSYAYSPACLANVLRSSKNGRFYVMTNFAEGPCVNCDPRNRLQIAEIDTTTLTIKKDTVTIIEPQDESLNQPDNIRFSNFRWYEDRETQNIVLHMTPGHDGSGWPQGYRPSLCAYCYEIELPG